MMQKQFPTRLAATRLDESSLSLLVAKGRRLGVLAAFVLIVTGCSNYQAGGSRTIGEFTDDVGIQGAVKTALIRDDELNGLGINVEVNRSVVTLYGRIPSEYARKKALDITADIRGVQEVIDRLTLVTD